MNRRTSIASNIEQQSNRDKSHSQKRINDSSSLSSPAKRQRVSDRSHPNEDKKVKLQMVRGGDGDNEEEVVNVSSHFQSNSNGYPKRHSSMTTKKPNHFNKTIVTSTESLFSNNNFSDVPSDSENETLVTSLQNKKNPKKQQRQQSKQSQDTRNYHNRHVHKRTNFQLPSTSAGSKNHTQNKNQKITTISSDEEDEEEEQQPVISRKRTTDDKLFQTKIPKIQKKHHHTKTILIAGDTATYVTDIKLENNNRVAFQYSTEFDPFVINSNDKCSFKVTLQPEHIIRILHVPQSDTNVECVVFQYDGPINGVDITKFDPNSPSSMFCNCDFILTNCIFE
jgi:hypothetical protein